MSTQAFEPRGPLEIGRTLGHYRLIERLGAGAMGEVFRAEDMRLGRSVALKFPHALLMKAPGTRERFLREARAASALDHPNIVTLYDVGEAEGLVFLAMQLVEGRSLEERLRGGPLPAGEAIAIARAVADGLAHAHARGIVHRDIKPANIMLGANARVKIADFGLARMDDAATLTQSGAMVGTLAYLAPEQIQGEPASAATDLYALGVTLYEMTTGGRPFGSGPAAALLRRVLDEEPPPLPAAVPEGLRDLVLSLLAKRTDQRPASAVEVADRLALLALTGLSPVASAPAAERGLERSIAVLPFANVTGDPSDEHFCAGMTEDLLTDMLRIPDLQVASRTLAASIRGSETDLKGSARRLGVTTVLEGGVRRSGGRVRVTARLVRAADGFQMWAERYDRDLKDIFEVQEDISRQIAAALSVVFDPAGAELRRARRTESPSAYDLRLQAYALRSRYEHSAALEAIERLGEALIHDPAYALGHADLAECYIRLVCESWDTDRRWLDQAERELGLALELAPSLPEAYRSRGHLRLHQGDLDQAIRDYHYAVELDPRMGDGLLRLAFAYKFLGEHSRAEVYARRGMSADPQDAKLPALLSDILLRQGRLSESREFARRTLSLTPGRYWGAYALTRVMRSHAREGELEAVAATMVELRDFLGDQDAFARAALGLGAALRGNADEARQWLAHPALAASHDFDIAPLAARAHVLIGDRSGALDALERITDLVDWDELTNDSELSRLKGEPRYDALLARLSSTPRR